MVDLRRYYTHTAVLSDTGTALGRLDRFDGIGPRTYGGPALMEESRLVIFNNDENGPF